MQAKISQMFAKRRKKLAGLLRQKKFEGILLTKKENILYLTGLDINDAFLLVNDSSKAIIFSDPRYKLGLSLNTDLDINFRIYEHANISFLKFVALELKKENFKKIAIEDCFSLFAAERLKKYISNLRSIHGAVETVRKVKESQEISLIKKAAKIGRSALRYVGFKLKSGLTEERVAFEAERFVWKKASPRTNLAFKTLVTSGPRTALPHGLPTKKRIKKGENLLIDFGVKLDSYNSDLTRMLSVGRISSNVKKIVRIVRDAQRFAIEKVKPDIKANIIDKAARDFIEKKGYVKFFVHATGHGIGLEVHEQPLISATNKEPLKAGMVFTIEPAIYIPGEGGARFEDMILVTEENFRIL
jgi:Xaa-Pro aminopeptidase